MARSSSLASRHSSILCTTIAAAATAAVLFSASAAHAQGPAPQLPPPAAQPAQPATVVVAQPAPVVVAAPPQGKPVTVVSTGADGASTISVTLGDHAGVEDPDANTIREIVAHDLASHRAPSGSYEVRMGKLGSKLLLVLEHRTEGGIEERHTLITGVEEAPIASQRVVDAIVNNKPLEETANVSNVLSQEARTPLQKQGRPGFAGGIIGVTPVGVKSGVGAGAELGMVYESEHFALSAHGRLAGGSGGSDTNMTYFNLGVGARYFVSDGDFAPYIGGGTGFSAYNVSTPEDNFGGSGLNLYGEAGVEAFRTHRVSMIAGLRADAPLFAMNDGNDKKYAVPVSLNVGMVFK